MTENPASSRRPSASSTRVRIRALPPWTLLAAGVLTGGLAGGAYGMLTPPAYTATSYVIAVPTDRSDPASALGFATAYGRVATQLAVLGDAQAQAGVPVDTLRRSVRTSTSPDAPMVAVSATSPRPRVAAGMANAVAAALTRRADATKGSTHVELLDFSRALAPTVPASASPALTGLVGASAGGLLAALGLLVGRTRHPNPVAGAAGARLRYLPWLAAGWLVVVGSSNYWHSKPRLLLVDAIIVIPLALQLGGRSTRVVPVAVGLLTLASLWFGAYMVTGWPYAI